MIKVSVDTMAAIRPLTKLRAGGFGNIGSCYALGIDLVILMILFCKQLLK